jgi:hypothetical protein
MRRFQPFTRSPNPAGCRLSPLSTIVGRPPPPEIKVSYALIAFLRHFLAVANQRYVACSTIVIAGTVSLAARLTNWFELVHAVG